MIVDHTDTFPPGNMAAAPCTRSGCTDWDWFWGIKILTHHHPAGIPLKEESYAGTGHLLFDVDRDLVTGWKWSDDVLNFRIKYLPRMDDVEAENRKNDFLQTGRDWPDPLELGTGVIEDDDFERREYVGSLGNYKMFTLATKWDWLYGVPPVTEEEIAAVKASILRDMNA